MSSNPPSRRSSRGKTAPARPTPPPQPPATTRQPWLLPAIAGVVVVLAAVVAIVLANGAGGSASAIPSSSTGSSAEATSGGSPAAVSSVVPSAAGGSGPVGSLAAGSAPVIEGTPLEPFPETGTDPAVGATAPTVTTATGSIARDGRPKAILFFAHWCPHCQAELPRVQAWITGGGVPPDVDFVSVSTGIDPSRPNYPPEAWLTSIGWTPPVLTDTDDSIAAAYGLTFYPFWTFLDADGTVAQRLVGELTTEQIDAVIAELQR